MKCNHCGLCCHDPLTQVNITIGDVWRIADFLKVDVEELFKEKIGLNPFREPEYEDIYDIDLGLNLPCKFWVNERCIIYPVMPLNCRLFPQWVLGNVPDDNVKDVVTDHKCEYDLNKKKDYRKYADEVGKILIEESKFYRMVKKINIKGLFDVKGKDVRDIEFNIVQKLRNMFKNDLNISDIKQVINENLDKIKENKKRLDENEKSHGLRNI
jgi:Fe-S-cluster containining protein